MTRFGLETYYSGGGGSNNDDYGGGECILHVSVASVRGDVIPRMLERRRRRRRHAAGTIIAIGGDDRAVRCVPLFTPEEPTMETRGTTYDTLPVYIPVRVDRVQCDFGKYKRCTIPL
ncbi:hypothetical protein ACHAXA_001205 [Cyclostephanos tholiformis]|uniref:Uncharacterized protein n=1 Tax=Cyclostephanos tholiformis TaxID=382380 RepID=A0ABD3SQ24_9STRA